MEITIGWTSGDPESAYFAQYLAKMFLEAGSKISAFAPFGMLGTQLYGLNISGSERDEINLLVESLAAAGLTPSSVKIDSRKPDGTKYYTNIFVGFRTPPSLTK
jgi:hypothetical protein